MLAQKDYLEAEIQRVADDLRMEFVLIQIDVLRRQMLEQRRRPQGRGPQGGQEEGQEEEQDDVQENGQ